MDRNLAQATFMDGLLADYGADIGIPDLSFDDNGVIGLSIHGIELHLFRLETDGILMIKSLLETETNLSKVAGPLAALTLTALQAGYGIVGYDDEVDSWMWGNRLDCRAMSVSEFSDRLESSARHVAFWAEQIAVLVEDAATEGSSSESRDDWMIRP